MTIRKQKTIDELILEQQSDSLESGSTTESFKQVLYETEYQK